MTIVIDCDDDDDDHHHRLFTLGFTPILGDGKPTEKLQTQACMKESSTLLFQPPYSSVAVLYIGMFQNRGAPNPCFFVFRI
jgi:hypothetical protein